VTGYKAWRQGGLALGLALMAATAAAQTAGPPARTPAQVQSRYQIFVMEGVLERAVEHGADMLRTQVRAVMPDTILIAGAARARGFRLEGYGMFFDVEVPALRRSVAWSFRMLDQNDLGLDSALKALRTHVQSIGDQAARENLDQALRRLELQVGPVAAPAPAAARGQAPVVTGSPAAVAMAAARQTQERRPSFLDDPGEAYTSEVKRALTDAMLDHSGPIAIGTDEWLAVAARDNENRPGLAPGDPEVSTITLRIKGGDLTAFRAGKLTRDEVVARIEIREF